MVGGQLSREPGAELPGGLCKSFEGTGLYLVGPGEPLKDIKL